MIKTTLTEDQAIKKLCPFDGCGRMVLVNAEANPSCPENELWERRCAASGCMAWTWDFGRSGSLMKTNGYCWRIKP